MGCDAPVGCEAPPRGLRRRHELRPPHGLRRLSGLRQLRAPMSSWALAPPGAGLQRGGLRCGLQQHPHRQTNRIVNARPSAMRHEFGITRSAWGCPQGRTSSSALRIPQIAQAVPGERLKARRQDGSENNIPDGSPGPNLGERRRNWHTPKLRSWSVGTPFNARSCSSCKKLHKWKPIRVPALSPQHARGSPRPLLRTSEKHSSNPKSQAALRQLPRGSMGIWAMVAAPRAFCRSASQRVVRGRLE